MRGLLSFTAWLLTTTSLAATAPDASLDALEEGSRLEETFSETHPARLEAEQPTSPVRTYDVNRPWRLELLSSPTAFVLDRGEWELGLGTAPTEASQLDMNELGLHARYGLIRSLTLGVFVSNPMESWEDPFALVDALWNISNLDTTSFALRAWWGRPYKKGSQAFNMSYTLHREGVGASFVVSEVIRDRLKLHLALGFHRGLYRQTPTEVPEAMIFYSTSRSTTSFYRLSAGLEWRLSRRHGLGFSLSPQLKTERSRWGFEEGSTETLEGGRSFAMGLMGGVGYTYNLEKLGFSAGIEGGPYYSKYAWSDSYSSYGYFAFLGNTNLNFSVDYRF